MTERTIYNGIATAAATILPGWQIPAYGADWPPRGKRLEMEITSNLPIEPGFTGRKITLVASFVGAGEQETSVAIRAFIAVLSIYGTAFTVLRIERGESGSTIATDTGEITDTETLTLYIEPRHRQQEP